MTFSGLNMNKEQQERRGFFRIEDTVNLTYKLVDQHKVTELSRVSGDVLSNCSLVAALDVLTQEGRIAAARVEKNEPEVFEFLKILDSKINLLAQAVMMQGNHFNESDERKVNMSATGLAFETDEQLSKGQFLEIKIMLASCMAVIIAYGQIIYCKENDEDDKLAYTVAVDFVNMKENDRELLIKHVVKKQMQQIRESKQS